MNERIKELSGKALDIAIPETYTEINLRQFQKFRDTFAKLIIEECISIVNKRKDAAIDAGWLVDEAMTNAVWDIEEQLCGIKDWELKNG